MQDAQITSDWLKISPLSISGKNLIVGLPQNAHPLRAVGLSVTQCYIEMSPSLITADVTIGHIRINPLKKILVSLLGSSCSENTLGSHLHSCKVAPTNGTPLHSIGCHSHIPGGPTLEGNSPIRMRGFFAASDPLVSRFDHEAIHLRGFSTPNHRSLVMSIAVPFEYDRPAIASAIASGSGGVMAATLLTLNTQNGPFADHLIQNTHIVEQ